MVTLFAAGLHTCLLVYFKKLLFACIFGAVKVRKHLRETHGMKLSQNTA